MLLQLIDCWYGRHVMKSCLRPLQPIVSPSILTCPVALLFLPLQLPQVITTRATRISAAGALQDGHCSSSAASRH